MAGESCWCRCGYRCGPVCKLPMMECLQATDGKHFVRECGHDFTGPEWTSEDGCMSSVTCKGCGLPAIFHDMRTGP